MLKAHGGFILPDNVPANEFLNLENAKISTSNNWAVWLHEYLDEFPGKEDVLRYVLCANAPETKDNDFTWKDFQTRNNSELVAVFGNFVNRAVVLTHKYFDGKVPPASALTAYDEGILKELPAIRQAMEDGLETYHFREALKEAMNLARLGNKYLTETEPWKLEQTDRTRVAAILNTALQICANCAIAFEPFLPFTAEKLRYILGQNKQDWNRLGSAGLLPAGHKLNEPQLLFGKIDDAEIQKQMDKLHPSTSSGKDAGAGSGAEAATAAVRAAAEVSFDDFEKMDIRTATVLEAERVPKTDKLLKLKIHTGTDTRTIVSGIAEHYTPEEITGKQICILANLAPRTIKGIESQGMILMAKQPDGKMKIIQPEERMDNGATIS
jgi:methionyl-tRNA synthetase